MFHLIWYAVIGFIAGLIAKSVMHTHLSLLWTVVLGIVGSVVGGCVTHLLSRPREGVISPGGSYLFHNWGDYRFVFVAQAKLAASSWVAAH